LSQRLLPERVHEVIFSLVFPDLAGAWPGLKPRELAEWILADGLRVRLGMQLYEFMRYRATYGV
jgi:hypothetical protein